MTPGSRIRAICARWCSADTMARLVDPTVTDLRIEYAAALRQGRWPARRALLVGYTAFVNAMAVHGCRAYGRAIVAASGADWWRTVRGPLAAVAIITLGLAAWPVAEMPRTVQVGWPFLVACLIPQALALALPIGLGLGLIVPSPTGARRGLALVATIAVATCGIAFANAAWIFPASNQLFRVSAAGHALVRGVNELTLGELATLLEPGTHAPMLVAPPAQRFAIAASYHVRLALSAAPLVLAVFGMAVRARAFGAVGRITAIAVLVGYYVAAVAGAIFAFDGTWPVAAGAWLANGIIALTSVVLLIVESQ